MNDDRNANVAGKYFNNSCVADRINRYSLNSKLHKGASILVTYYLWHWAWPSVLQTFRQDLYDGNETLATLIPEKVHIWRTYIINEFTQRATPHFICEIKFIYADFGYHAYFNMESLLYSSQTTSNFCRRILVQEKSLSN